MIFCCLQLWMLLTRVGPAGDNSDLKPFIVTLSYVFSQDVWCGPEEWLCNSLGTRVLQQLHTWYNENKDVFWSFTFFMIILSPWSKNLHGASDQGLLVVILYFIHYWIPTVVLFTPQASCALPSLCRATTITWNHYALGQKDLHVHRNWLWMTKMLLSKTFRSIFTTFCD